MGLFSSKKVTTITVATQAIRVIADDKVPDSTKYGAVEALINDTSLSDTVENRLVNSIGMSILSFYRQAKKQYIWGLPSDQFLAMQRGNPTVITAIAAKEKVPESEILLEYSYYMPKNLYHLAWEDLIKNHGYNATTNKLGKLSTELKQDVYLDDLELVIKPEIADDYDKIVLEPWGRPTTSFYSPSRLYETNSETYKVSTHAKAELDTKVINSAIFYIHYAYYQHIDSKTDMSLKPGLVQDYISMPARLKDIESIETKEGTEGNLEGHLDFFQVKYRIKDKTKFIREPASFVSSKPIEEIFTLPNTTAGNFFPFVYFRWDKKDLSIDKTTQEYKDSVKLMKSINLDYDDMCHSIHYEQVTAETDEYETVIDDDPANKATYGKEIKRKKTKPVKETDPVTGKTKIKEKLNAHLTGIKSVLLFFAVPPETKNIVEIKFLFDWFSLRASSPDNKNTLELITDSVPSNNRARNFTRAVENYNSIVIQDKRFKMALQHQGISVVHRYYVKKADDPLYSMKTNAPGSYTYTHLNSDFTAIDVTVTGLKMVYNSGSGVSANYTDTADGKQNTDRKHLLVPIDYTITKKYSMKDREILYSRAQHLLYNTEKITVTTIPWYTTGFFKIFIAIIIIIIVVLVVIFAPALAPAALVAAGTAFAAGATALAIVILTIFIIKMIIIAVIMHFVMKAIAKAIGPEAAMYLSLVIIVASIGYGAYGALTAPTLAASQAAMSSASFMLSAGTALTSAAADEFQHQIEHLAGDWEEFKSSMSAKEKEIEAAKELLNNNSLLLMPLMVLGETPENYYNRISHNTNPGVACFGLLESFCDTLLTLPTINDTIRSK